MIVGQTGQSLWGGGEKEGKREEVGEEGEGKYPPEVTKVQESCLKGE